MARKIEITSTNTKETIESHNTIILDILESLVDIEKEGEIIKSVNMTVETIDAAGEPTHETVTIYFPYGSRRYPEKDDADDYSRGCCDEL